MGTGAARQAQAQAQARARAPARAGGNGPERGVRRAQGAASPALAHPRGGLLNPGRSPRRDTENQNRAFSAKTKQHSMLIQKNCLVKNLKRFQKQLEAGKLEATKCAFIPKTFKMLSEHYLFVEEFCKNPGITILKPVSMCSPKESEAEMNGCLRSAEGEENMRACGSPADLLSGLPSRECEEITGDSMSSLERKLGSGEEAGTGGFALPCESGPSLVLFSCACLVQYFLHHSPGQQQSFLPWLFPNGQCIPLKAWLYRGGFARFSNTRFTLNSRDDHCILPVCVCHKEGIQLSCRCCCHLVSLLSFFHWKTGVTRSLEMSPFFFLGFTEHVRLTNVAVQKATCDYDPRKYGCVWMSQGCKGAVQQLRQHSTSQRGAGSVEVLFVDTDNAFIHSLQSVQKAIISDKQCFELYGYDILIHEDLKPCLLEVNASPSLTASSQEDCELKCHLLEDTLHIVGREGRLTRKGKRVGGFDPIRNDGPVSRGGKTGYSGE
ncbi:LOW QUALITY PROTEIN: putative tubulin polyglutamylase TTLL9 [Spheniscus humboldti]